MPSLGLDDAASTRQQLRQAMLARRLALGAADVTAHSEAIGRHLDAWLRTRLNPAACRLAFCWPVQNEPDLRPLLQAWQQAGALPLLPVVVAPGQPLIFRAWTPGMPLAIDRYGIPFPASGHEQRPDALLLPCNAFDNQGFRIGYGGGFFDRSLAALAASGDAPPLVIGVAYAFQQIADTRPQPHDWPMAAVVTEDGVLLTEQANTD